jgi:hypothetical protein
VVTSVNLSTGPSAGPLVSRGSAALGPLLGTSHDEETPSIDRNERAFDYSIERLSSEYGSGFLHRTQGVSEGEDGSQPSAESPESSALESNGPLIAVRGAGGVRLLVSTIRGSRTPADPALILATVDPARDLEAATGDCLESGLIVVDQLAVLEKTKGTEEEPNADVLKTVCGLMMGLGLATGPLYPDLIALVGARMPRPLKRTARRAICPSTRRSWFGGLATRLGF